MISDFFQKSRVFTHRFFGRPLSIRDSFGEAAVTLNKILGSGVSASRFEIVNRESANSYDEFYENKELPTPESEGETNVIEFDGKGVPIT